MMSEGGRAARGARVTLGGQALKFALQLTSTVVLARLLVPEDFGLFAMVIAVTGFAALLGDFGLSNAAVQAENITDQQRSNLFWISTGVGALLYALLFTVAPLIQDFYRADGLAVVVQVMSVGFLLSAIASQFTAHLTRNLSFGRLAIIDVSSQAAGLAFALSLAINGAGYWALVGQQLASAGVLLVLTALLSGWVPRWPAPAPMRSLLTFAANSLGVQALSYVSGNADSVALGRTSGPEALGLYDRAYQLFKIPVQQIAAPLTRVALPILSRQQSNRPQMSRYVLSAQLGMSYVLGAAFCLGAALASPVIELALGPQWSDAAPLFAILAFGGVFQVMGYVYYWSFLACGLTALQLRFSLVTRALMVGLIIIGAFFGPTGVALAVAVGLALNWVVLSAFPMRRTGLDVGAIARTGGRGIAVNVVMAAAVWGVDNQLLRDLTPLARLGIGVSAGLAVYALLAATAPPVRRDLATIFRMAKRSFR
ncbi:lipopolysaccharide biosynthesis protein [Microbacterium oleivorans]|uniref:Lipopolysaccharide biosynthesis protein n=1 Tax=Microbacterium oleivorans TaxID=273677 RepID=A0A7D5IR30_9MICO|nr:lipopolysaccharide biosynthesis protein [Microbacterium oleivorans]QLD12261.1 lipopolysaccharide biosynthesis protein [Microbacterium oleivorans]